MKELFSPGLYPLFWLILALSLGFIEAVTVQLVAIWFALGAVAAIFPALLGMPMWVQFFTFVVVAALTLLLTRPFLNRVLRQKKEHTNADRVVGETAVVRQEIDNDSSSGRVSVMGLDWSARSADGSDIPQGSKVTVLGIEGVTLLVTKKEAAVMAAEEEQK